MAQESTSGLISKINLLCTQLNINKQSVNFKVFRYSFSEAKPIFFNRLKSGFFPCSIAIKVSPVTGYGLKFVKM